LELGSRHVLLALKVFVNGRTRARSEMRRAVTNRNGELLDVGSIDAREKRDCEIGPYLRKPGIPKPNQMNPGVSHRQILRVVLFDAVAMPELAVDLHAKGKCRKPNVNMFSGDQRIEDYTVEYSIEFRVNPDLKPRGGRPAERAPITSRRTLVRRGSPFVAFPAHPPHAF